MNASAPSERAATIYDVAARAGVAPSTVSRALSRPGRVSSATAEAVREAARAVGYHRAPLTSSFNPLPTKLLAIVLADIANPVFSEIARGAQTAAEQLGYTVVIVDAQESGARERHAAERFKSSVDGLILASPRLSDSGIRSIAKERPVITLNRQVPGLAAVLTDGALGAWHVATHLYELGHRSVTYVSGPETSWADGMRWRGLKAAGESLGLRARRIGPFPPTMSGGARATHVWRESRTSAVFAYNDVMAIGFMRAILKSGFTVPGEVSIAGFDNSYATQLTTPTLTSVASPLHQQGATAASNLIAMVNGAKSSEHPVTLPVKLMERESTGEAAS